MSELDEGLQIYPALLRAEHEASFLLRFGLGFPPQFPFMQTLLTKYEISI